MLHLLVIQPNQNPDMSPATYFDDLGYDTMRHEFFWNSDFTAVRPVRLRWWDDASYVAYQAGYDDMSLEVDDVPTVDVAGGRCAMETYFSPMCQVDNDIPF